MQKRRMTMWYWQWSYKQSGENRFVNMVSDIIVEHKEWKWQREPFNNDDDLAVRSPAPMFKCNIAPDDGDDDVDTEKQAVVDGSSARLRRWRENHEREHTLALH